MKDESNGGNDYDWDLVKDDSKEESGKTEEHVKELELER